MLETRLVPGKILQRTTWQNQPRCAYADNSAEHVVECDFWGLVASKGCPDVALTHQVCDPVTRIISPPADCVGAVIVARPLFINR